LKPLGRGMDCSSTTAPDKTPNKFKGGLSLVDEMTTLNSGPWDFSIMMRVWAKVGYDLSQLSNPQMVPARPPVAGGLVFFFCNEISFICVPKKKKTSNGVLHTRGIRFALVDMVLHSSSEQVV